MIRPRVPVKEPKIVNRQSKGPPARRRRPPYPIPPKTATSILTWGKAIGYSEAMRISELIWAEDRVAHIAEHGVRPYEVEEVCFGHPLVLRGRSAGRNPVYYVLGQTTGGRHLFCVVVGLPDSQGYVVTARLMTAKEERRFKQWKKQI